MSSWTPEYRPLEEATTPRDGECMVDRWWVHLPGQGLAFARFSPRHATPQCNRDRRITEHIQQEIWPDHEVIHVPVVYVGWVDREGPIFKLLTDR